MGLYIADFRVVAQLGSVPRSGRGGRGFKSRLPDQKNHQVFNNTKLNNYSQYDQSEEGNDNK